MNNLDIYRYSDEILLDALKAKFLYSEDVKRNPA